MHVEIVVLQHMDTIDTMLTTLEKVQLQTDQNRIRIENSETKADIFRSNELEVRAGVYNLNMQDRPHLRTEYDTGSREHVPLVRVNKDPTIETTKTPEVVKRKPPYRSGYKGNK